MRSALLILACCGAAGFGLAPPCASHGRSPSVRAVASDDVHHALATQPRDAGALLQLAGGLVRLDATPLAVAQLTDAIEQTVGSGDGASATLASTGDFLRRTRRKLLLATLLRADRA
eukprot:6356607-Prymnesium_polylepis.1